MYLCVNCLWQHNDCTVLPEDIKMNEWFNMRLGCLCLARGYDYIECKKSVVVVGGRVNTLTICCWLFRENIHNAWVSSLSEFLMEVGWNKHSSWHAEHIPVFMAFCRPVIGLLCHWWIWFTKDCSQRHAYSSVCLSFMFYVLYMNIMFKYIIYTSSSFPWLKLR